MKNKYTISELLNNYSSFHQLRVDELMTKLNSQYLFEFAWIAEDIYKLKYNISYYNSIVSDIINKDQFMINETEPTTNRDVLNYHIKKLSDYCKTAYNVRENSTGTLHREVSTWKFQCNLDLIEVLEKVGRICGE